MVRRVQFCFDPTTAAQPSSRHTCRIYVSGVHKLVDAAVWFQNIVATGVLTVSLKAADEKDVRGGKLIGTALGNTDLAPTGLDITSQNNRFAFTLADVDKATSPARRSYFLILNGDNAADRLDEAMLELVYDEV